ncbi:MAG: 16S rRNA (adenine(1518)-N(6)/adenine(1519)-N(6))-dimethyltransferase RsmA [Gammaproteobacteria bacterium]|nr:16S rRNA (adenine(1518)-N(6)/adenine(1519)-N(6))-dimethyltransferase RsmA [Gammaproteobacteria bacterium]
MGNPPVHRARKRFGQHFLHDRNIIDKILRAIDVTEGDNFLEIGPGQGALTFPLLQRCKNLIAVELDRDLIPLLTNRASAFGELQVINADILKFELTSIANTTAFRIVGNLPYNISTPLMFHLLESIALIKDMHFMVQKEVAQRIVAPVGDKHYGRLSIMMQYRCACQYLFDVRPGSFTPPPKVDSAIIRLLPHARPIFEVGDIELFSNIVRSAFAQRRKTISNSLKSIVDADIFEQCEIDKGMRAENLSGRQYASITNKLLAIDQS